MNENLELYKHILKDSDMSVYSLTKLLDYLKDKDNKIKKTIEDILKGYERYLEEAKEYLKNQGEDLEYDGMMAKAGASMGIKMEVKNDNSDSSMADMLIKGISQGSIDMEKKIKQYEEDAEKDELKLAKDFLKFQQDIIENLKKYL